MQKYVLRERKKTFSRAVLRDVLRCPIMTEKSHAGREIGQYFFSVATWANKISIARAVEDLFSVKVKSVNTLNVKGKRRRFKGRLGISPGLKKAIVSLSGDDVIHLDERGRAE